MYPEFSRERLDKTVQCLLNSKWVPFSSSMRTILPEAGGVYRICDVSNCENKILYAGLSGNLRDRLYRKHFMGNPKTSTLKRKLVGIKFDSPAEVKEYLRSSCEAQFCVIEDERLRRLAEQYIIALLQPPYND
ncbi:hypothetical protein A3197_03315 [Candidatus Thiodiazotropha endoloripes]|nr:hypothetical protein A3197_03315 [Candidatus Thiodiazotropha endoloripes]